MKPIYFPFGGALALSFTIAACVPAPDSTPAPKPIPTPSPVQTAPPPSAAAPAPPRENWIDEARSPGEWTYRSGGADGSAQYVDSRGAPVFSILCMADGARIALVRHGAGSDTPAMTIRTETSDRMLNTSGVSPDAAGRPAIAAYLSRTDPLLDAMALTRGRFAVEIPGLSTLYLPPWAEVTRVIEDCR